MLVATHQFQLGSGKPFALKSMSRFLLLLSVRTTQYGAYQYLPVMLFVVLSLGKSVHKHVKQPLLLQAVERAISELTRLQKPLVKESEVAELSIGARSKEKVLEIIQTGTLRRNEMMADDEELQVMQKVLFKLLQCMT